MYKTILLQMITQQKTLSTRSLSAYNPRRPSLTNQIEMHQSPLTILSLPVTLLY